MHYFSLLTLLINCKAYFPAQRKLYPEGALLNKKIGGSDRFCRFQHRVPHMASKKFKINI